MNSKQLSRREFLRLGGLTGAGVLLAACAPKATPAPTAAPTEAPAAPTEAPAAPTEAPAEPTEAPPAVVEEVPLVYISWSESNDPHFKHMVARWNEDHPEGPKLRYEPVLVTGPDEAITKVMNAMAAGADIPDIFPLEISYFSKFLKDDPPLVEAHLLDMTPLLDVFNPNWKEDYIGFAPYTWQGKVYGVEVGLAPCGYYYRKDLFDEVGIETPLETWEDWMAAGAEMAKAGHAMCAAYYSSGTAHLFMLLYQAGGAVFDINGELTIEDERTYKIMQLLVEGVDAGIIWMNEDYWGPTHYAALNDGTVAGVPSAIWYSPHVLKPNVAPEHVGKWRLQPLPTWKTSPPWGGPNYNTRRTSTWGGSALTVPKNGPHPELTFDWLAFAFLTEEGGASVFQNMGQMPMVKKVIHDDSVTNIPDDFYGGQAVNKVFADIADEIPPKYMHPFWAEADTEIQKIMPSAYAHEGSYEDLIKQAADAIREIIATA